MANSNQHSELAAHLRKNGCSQCAAAADLIEQYENLKEQLDSTGKAAVREARRSANFLARAENAERKWAVERDRANGLLEQLEATRAALLPFAEAANEKLPMDAVLRAREVLYPTKELDA